MSARDDVQAAMAGQVASVNPYHAVQGMTGYRAFLHLFNFHASCFMFNVIYGMITLLVPLYALNLGYNALEIGIIVSVIGYSQIVARLGGGPLADWLGERPVLIGSSAFMALAGALFIPGALSLWFLIGGQLLSGLARAWFWSPAQSYASRIDSTRMETHVSHFNSSTSAGYLLGLLLAGATPPLIGFTGAIVTFTGLSVISTLLWFITPEIPNPTNQARTLKGSFIGMAEASRIPALYISGICAFMGAMITALVGSFYPIYMEKELGFASFVVGAITAIRSLGSIFGNIALAPWMTRIRPGNFYTGLIVLLGLSLAAVQWFRDPITLSILLGLTGFMTGGVVLYNIVLAGWHSEARLRGAAMAFTNLFWSLALIAVPPIFGFLAEIISLGNTFLVVGIVVALFGIATRPLHDRLVPPRPTTQPA